MFSHSSMIWLILWPNGSGWSFGLMALVDPLVCWLHPSHWCLLDILACLLAWISSSSSNSTAFFNSGLHLVVAKAKISSVVSPRSWRDSWRERPLGPTRSLSSWKAIIKWTHWWWWNQLNYDVMRHSYYQKGTHQKRNTHLIKKELIKKEHSYYQKGTYIIK